MRVCARYLIRLSVVMLLAAGPWGDALGLNGARAAEADTRMELATGAGELIRLPRPAVSVFVANPDVADVQVPSPGAIFLMGKKAGTTTLYAIDGRDNEILHRTVVVSHNLAEMRELLAQRFPAYRFTLTSAPGSVMVAGTVDTATQVAGVADTLGPYISKDERLVNNVAVRNPTQVHLRVRVAEVSREITQKFGVNWQAILQPGNFVAGLTNGRDFLNDDNQIMIPETGWGALGGWHSSHNTVNAVIDALDQEGLISVMAEPTMTAVSGQTASFLVGGEFPIPVVQAATNAITVEFKPFGVALDFTPTVLSSDRISLLVRPEVSELSTSNAVTIAGVSIPALSVRRIETTVELASGQSFVLGGLLQDNMRDIAARLPGLGNLPVLGKLFSSQAYANNKTELVVIVTAYTVKPSDGNQLQTPLRNLKPASDVEYIHHQRLGTDPLAADTPRLVGPAGFVY